MQSFKSAFLSLCSACFVLICSCSNPAYLSQEDLSQYLSTSHKLSNAIVSNDVTIKVTYKPTDLLVAQELGMNKNPTEKEIRDARNKYNSHYYFAVSFSKSGREILSASTGGVNNFSDLLQRISFRMAEVVNLTTSNRDTIPVADYVYNRSFGMGHSTDLLFVFDKSKTKNSESIQINLDEFGLGTGKQSIRFNVSDLQSAPKIFKP
jgi:hypothetical protein